VSTAGGVAAGGGTATYSQLQGVAAGLQTQITGLQNQVDDNRREARAGIALAMASSGLQYDTRPGKASLAAAVGYYKGQSGLAVGLGYAVSSRWRVNAAFTGTPEVNEYGAVAGSSWTLN
jgi:trimeric autotransporter adhesin